MRVASGCTRLREPPRALGQPVAEALARARSSRPAAACRASRPSRRARRPRPRSSQPRSSASATKASVTPIVIVSIPSRSQRSLARVSEPACALPSMEPKAKMVSYSGIFALSPASSPVADLVLLAAGHRALEAGGVPVVIVRVHLLAGDGERLGEGLLAEVVGAERPQRVDGLDEERRAVGRQRLGPRRHRLAPLVDEGLERRRVGQLGLARPRHRHRLDVLGAQHRADAAAAGHALAVLPVGGQRREADAPSRPRGRWPSRPSSGPPPPARRGRCRAWSGPRGRARAGASAPASVTRR